MPPFPLARRLSGIAPFHVMDILARARQLEVEGRDIIHLEIGEPDFPTPAPVLAAAATAMQEGDLFYTPALGLPSLREAIGGFYRDRYGVAVSPSRVVVTPGASGALLLATGLTLDPGDGILMADPGYPCNRHFARFLNAVPQPVPVDATTRFQLTADLVSRHITPVSRAVLLASPSNPTGTVCADAEVAAIAAVCAEHGLTLIVDEIYHGLIYGDRVQTAAALGDDVVVVSSFSKYFDMTGWRVGWLLVPAERVEAADRLAQNLFLAAPTLSQRAAIAALQPATLAILEERKSELKGRRDYLLGALAEIGFRIPVIPEGAFYIYADSASLAADSFDFTRRMLVEAGVAATPGVDFGDYRPERHVRFAYTTEIPRLTEAVGRLAAWLRS